MIDHNVHVEICIPCWEIHYDERTYLVLALNVFQQINFMRDHV